MASSPKLRLRRLWFQVHKWLGLVLALLIIPISLTGSALVWHDWVDEQLNPQRYQASGPAALPPSAYAAAVQPLLEPGERLTSIAFPDGHGSVQATLGKPAQGGGRPARAWVWMDPSDARVIERAGAGEGLVRVMHVLHGSLMVPGVGRQIVGWVGAAMLISSLTGLWLWWPLTGGFRRGLRWRRQNSANANLHHQMGFWIALPLAMLSFTGVWISFPAFFAGISGAAAPGGGGPGGGGQAQPLVETRLGPDGALAAARPHATGPLTAIAWPTDRSPEWRVSFKREGGNAEVKVRDADGVATPPSPPQPETFARTMRRWHDGSGMGPGWQIVIFIGGILPALLAVTGIIMWLRTRRWRGEAARKQSARRREPIES
ncbi:MAG TPA: PepSY-associated TM helix domain-containing protein [Allosphingosinicella sp.]|jgi:uncharacterized iron-regulated membrane protein